MKIKRSSVLRFLSLLKPHWRLVGAATAAGILRYFIPLSVPWGIKIIIDDFLKPGRPTGFAKLHILAGSLIGLFILWAMLSFLRLYFTGLAGNRVIFDLRHRLYLHVQKMSLNYFEKRKIGSVVSKITHDITAAQQLVGYGVTSTVMDASSIVVIAAIMFALHWKLALVSFAVIPFYVAASQFFSRKIRVSGREVHQQIENLTGYLQEKLGGISLTRAFVREKEEELVFLNHSESHLHAFLSSMKQQALGLSVTGFLTSIAPILVIWYGAVCVMKGGLTVGELVAFYSYVALLYMPVARLSELNVVIASSLAAMDRIFEVLDTSPEILENPYAVNIKTVKGHIRFRNVEFSYDEGTNLLRDFNLEIYPKEFVAITGPSGSGKSTLIKLLLRFYDVRGGGISMDEWDIREFTLAALRRQIGLVMQEPILFSGTVYENILYGNPAASRGEVIRAAQDANAHEFISRLPEKYETQAGERGVLFSAGERQRIAIARAFLKNAPILILDEPTSALDAFSSLMVKDSLKELRKGKTTLMIAHLPSSIEDADSIIRLSGGAAVEFSSKTLNTVL